MNLDPQLLLGFRGDELPLLQVVPLTVGQGPGDDRHHVVLLAPQMRQQNVCESVEGT